MGKTFCITVPDLSSENTGRLDELFGCTEEYVQNLSNVAVRYMETAAGKDGPEDSKGVNMWEAFVSCLDGMSDTDALIYMYWGFTSKLQMHAAAEAAREKATGDLLKGTLGSILSMLSDSEGDTHE